MSSTAAAAAEKTTCAPKTGDKGSGSDIEKCTHCGGCEKGKGACPCALRPNQKCTCANPSSASTFKSKPSTLTASGGGILEDPSTAPALSAVTDTPRLGTPLSSAEM